MWHKLSGEAEVEVRRQASTPMLEANIEALSEFSLADDVKSTLYYTFKKNEKIYTTICVLLILLLPVITFFAVLEIRRYQLTEYEALPVVDGSIHVAVTSCGLVEGVAKDGGFQFRGIPYAAATSKGKKGRDRWKPGSAATRLEHCWEGVKKYSNTKPEECLQLQQLANGSYSVIGNEDCQTLDVYTPHVGYDNPSPVVVVIAVPSLVGGWPEGALREQVTPSAKLAHDKNVVYVVPRFRLGPFGFLPRMLLNSTNEVIKNSSDFNDAIILAQRAQVDMDKSYNLGLTDLMAALVWVQLNAEHFGGDPRVVTLLGWGAGSSLVTAVTTIPPPRGHSFLFTQVWVTGGGNSLIPSNKSAPNYLPGMDLWAKSPCTSLPYSPYCLMSLPADILMNSVPSPWISNYSWLSPDNYWFEKPAEMAWSDSNPPEGKDFPLVIGVTSDGAVDVASTCQDMELDAESGYKKLLRTLGPESSSRLLNFYSNASTTRSKLSMMTDSQLTCPLWQLAQTADGSFSSGVFFYVSSYPKSVHCSPSMLHVASGLSDISAILGRYRVQKLSDAKYVANMQSMFYSFLAEGTLPGGLRARHGFYDVQSPDIRQKSSYPPCTLWKESGLLGRFTKHF